MKRFLIAATLLVFVGLMFSEVNAGSIFGGNYIKRSGDTINGTLKVKTNTLERSVIQYQPSSDYIFLGDSTTGIRIVTSTSTNLFHRVSGIDYKLWTENNDGNGSGLDADLWKGKSYADAQLSFDVPALSAGEIYKHNTLATIATAVPGDFCVASTTNEIEILSYGATVQCTAGQGGARLIITTPAAINPGTTTFYFRVFKR